MTLNDAERLNGHCLSIADVEMQPASSPHRSSCRRPPIVFIPAVTALQVAARLVSLHDVVDPT